MANWRGIWLLWALMLGGSWLLHASPERVVNVISFQNTEGLEQALSIVSDSGGKASFAQVKDWYFVPIREYAQNMDRSRVYWGKITLISSMDEITDWVLHTGYNNYTDIYIEAGGKIQHKRSGELLPTAEKDIKEVRKDCAFKLRLVPRQPVTIYIRIESVMGYSPKFLISLETADSWELRDRLHYVFQSMFFGGLLIMVLYNIAVYISTGQKAYRYYAGFIASILGYFLWFHGFIHLFFLPDTPKLNTHFWPLSIVSPILYLQFIRLLLDLSALPKIDRVMQWAIKANVAVLVVAVGIFVFTFNSAVAVRFVNTVLAADALLFAFLLYKLSSMESKLVAFFLGGVAFFLCSVFLGVFGYSYLDWTNSVYAVQIGVIGQILLHSLGLGYKMQAAEQERQEMQAHLIKQLEDNHRMQEEANQALENKVKARTAEIAMQHTHIEEQNEELKALNEEKNNLIRIVAHDLKSPLNRVIGLINVIRLNPENLSGEQAAYMDLIVETSEKLRDMVIRILDIDAIDEHNPKFSFSVLNMADWLQQRVEGFQTRAREKYIDLSFEASHAHVPIHTDANYFEQIMENLISNAIKFSPKGSPIKVGIQIEENRALIYVKDHGQGLTEDDKKKLFKKYQKLSARPTAGEESTGLGLSIVKRYVELLEGQIWCESTYREGATFFVSMPIAVEAEQEMAR